MKTDKKILIAFILNLAFSVFEFVGGILTGSVAIMSDAVHDIGDAFSIGISYFLEKKSKKQPDEVYTYGYGRYSVIGSIVTTLILLCGSVIVIYNAVLRFIDPADIHYDGMILFAVVGVCVNLGAAFFTSGHGSLNQKAVNLHMLEDVLTWVVVLLGAAVMRVTQWTVLDPLVSIGVAAYIFVHAVGHLRAVVNIFLEKVPDGLSVAEIRDRLTAIEGVVTVRRLCVRSIDGIHHAAEVSLGIDGDPAPVKAAVRTALAEWRIVRVTVETEQTIANNSCFFDKTLV